jgi:hypothetical protein
MKDFITPSYTFSPGASGVGYVDLSGINNFDIKRLVAIINQTTGTIIYATASLATKYTNVTGTQVTLFADTTGQNPTDNLQVIYNSQEDLPVTDSNLSELVKLMSRMVKSMDSLAVVDANQRQRVVVETGTLSVVSTVPVVTAVTNIVSMSGMGNEQYLNIARNTYANSIRSKLSF